MGQVEPCSLKLKEFAEDSLKRTGDQIIESTQTEYKQAMKDFVSVVGNIDYRKFNPVMGNAIARHVWTEAKALRQLHKSCRV